MRRIHFMLLTGFILTACGSNDSIQDINEKGVEEVVLTDFELFLQSFDANDSIGIDYATQFLEPAMEHEIFFKDWFLYTYGEVLIESDDIVVLTFTAEGDEGFIDLYGTYLATYTLPEGEFIDATTISLSAYNEGHSRRGFNQDITISTEINDIGNDSFMLQLRTNYEVLDYEFNPAYYDETPEDTLLRTQQISHINFDGVIIEDQLDTVETFDPIQD